MLASNLLTLHIAVTKLNAWSETLYFFFRTGFTIAILMLSSPKKTGRTNSGAHVSEVEDNLHVMMCRVGIHMALD